MLCSGMLLCTVLFCAVLCYAMLHRLFTLCPVCAGTRSESEGYYICNNIEYDAVQEGFWISDSGGFKGRIAGVSDI